MTHVLKCAQPVPFVYIFSKSQETVQSNLFSSGLYIYDLVTVATLHLKKTHANGQKHEQIKSFINLTTCALANSHNTAQQNKLQAAQITTDMDVSWGQQKVTHSCTLFVCFF